MDRRTHRRLRLVARSVSGSAGKPVEPVSLGEQRGGGNVDEAGLGDTRGAMERGSGQSDSSAGSAPRPAHRVHRVRVPVDGLLPPIQPRWPARRTGSGTAIARFGL